jgi:L-ascorbate metabolism protein UlaG (beta-lactamase superfamily)
MEFDGISFNRLGHDGFRIKADNKTIYIDPYQLSKEQHNKNDADIVFISHNHFDHLSMDDLKQVVGKKTSIVAATECIEQLKASGVTTEVKGVAPGDKVTVQGIPIEAIAAYNTNKKFHPKADGKVGFVFTVNNMRIYHTGDADDIPEMSNTKPDVALVPVSGTYVMTAEEAARAVNEKIKPKRLAIPMHYGSIVGSKNDAKKFSELVTASPVQLLDAE